MNLSIFAEPGLVSEVKSTFREPSFDPVEAEIGRQHVPQVGDLLDYVHWRLDSEVSRRGVDRDYNLTVEELSRGSVPVIQVPGLAVFWGADAVLGRTSGQWFAEAEIQLEECRIDAEEDEVPSPSEVAIARSRELLQHLSATITSEPDIYTMDEGSVAIDFRTSDGSSAVLFIVNQDGSGSRFYRTIEERGRTRVDDATQFIREESLQVMRHLGIR